MDQLFSLEDLIDTIKRQIGVIAAVTLLGSVGALFYAMNQVHLYQATEVLQVTRPTIDNDLARSTVDGSSARRLQLIEQQLTTRGSMLEIADQFGIFEDTPDMTMGERVSRMRDAIQIRGVAAAREGFTDDGTVSVLSITATFDTPERAQGVAHEIARRTIEISTNQRIEQARETLRFFAEEEAKLQTALEDLNRRETAYRLENNLTIPGDLEARQTQIASLNESILTLERERITLQQSLAQLDPDQRASTLERAQSELNAQIQIIDQQRDLLERRVAELSEAIQISPQVERDLSAFERERANIQGELDVISTRRAEAEVGFKLEEQNQAERLTVIEPAARPDYPITGSRKRLVIMGSVASLIMGIGLAFLLDIRRGVIRSASQMQARVGLTPVVTIPALEPSRRTRKRLASAKIALAGYIHEARARQAARKEKG